ncbi:hypothetical protein ACFVR6_03665 [Microbacterium sp. NPDC058021]|uniref:hypothetical protein n=1 Tax=Microbacterium sp. NPDC058021 TaxID=3346306 RepID=UPI0036DAB751
MAMKSMRIELNRAGIVALLQSAELAADLVERGGRIASAAGDPEDYEVTATTNRDRTVVFVRTASPKGRQAEAEDRALTSAIDAGR